MVMESLATNIVTEMLLKPKTAPIIPPAPKEPEDTGPQLVQIVAKGAPVRVFEHASANGLSETAQAVDCRNWNMVHVDVIPNGTSPSATIILEGADEAGAVYNPLPSANGRHPAITANYSFEAPVGTAWLKVRIANISGTFGAGLGFTVVVTPYVGNPDKSGGVTKLITASYTRPANTTLYTAEDAIANATDGTAAILTLTGAANGNGGSGYITSFRVQTDQAANAANYRAHIYRVAPTALADNAACTAPLWADRTSYVGYIDSNALGSEGSGATAAHGQNHSDRLGFKCALGDANLYAIIETLTAFTPGSGQGFYFEWMIEAN